MSVDPLPAVCATVCLGWQPSPHDTDDQALPPVGRGAGFVAIRKGAGHFPGELLAEPTAPDYKGVRSVLRLHARAVRRLLERAGAEVAGIAVVVDQSAEPGVRSLIGRGGSGQWH